MNYEQKQLLELEKQQNMLQLRLLEMQKEFESKKEEEPKEEEDVLNQSIKVNQKQQEQFIKSICLKSAIFNKVEEEKTGAYKEEFI